MLMVNLLANILPIGIGNTGEVSARYPTLITPAPYTFMIWGVIYGFMFLFILYQWGCFNRFLPAKPNLKSIGIWFTLSCLLNIGWILAWHHDAIFLSVVLMFCLLISLIILSARTDIRGKPLLEKITSGIGFELYTGWIMVATIVNISVLLTKLEWNRFGLSESFWTIIILLVGVILSYLVMIFGHKTFVVLPFIWAYTGILVRHLSSTEFAGSHAGIIVIILAGISLMIIGLMISLGFLKLNTGKERRCQ